MKRRFRPLLGLIAMWCFAGVAFGQDTGATTSGNWENSSIWTGGAVPGSSNDVYIGSTYPGGAATTATVTLTASESAADVYLGNGNGTSGTLNLAGQTLTVGGNLVIGQGGTGVLNEGGGSFTAANLVVQNGNALTLGAGDVVAAVQLSGASSTVTTTATGNITGANNNSYVTLGSTLNLGANLNLNNSYLDVEDAGSTFNMNGHALTANALYLGWEGSSAVTLENPGALTLNSLYVGNNQTFNLTAADSVGVFNLSGGSTTLGTNVTVDSLNLSNGAVATTTATGNITGANNNSYVTLGSTLNLGANLNLNNSYLDVEDAGSTFNMNGHALTANALYLGWEGSSAVTLENPGALTLNSLYVGNNQTFNLTAADSVGVFNLSGGSTTLGTNVTVDSLNLSNGAVATTTATGNITGANNNSYVTLGSTLNLGANLNLNNSYLDVEDAGSTFNMNGHALTANALYLGWEGSSAVTLENPGALTLNSLYVGNNQTFNLTAADSVGVFNLSGGSTTLGTNVTVDSLNLSNGAVATTTATGNITGANNNSYVTLGSTLNLGANLNLNNSYLDVEDAGSTFNMNGHALTADALYLGWNGSSAVTVTNAGQFNLNGLYLGNGTTLTMHGGDVVNNQIDLTGNSVLTVDQVNGMGLTLNGTSLSSLTIDPSSMNLVFTSAAAGNWDFAWMDPSSGGNWISTIDTMIADGEIKLTLLPGEGYHVVDSNGYTYIMGINGAAVPEPSSLVLACIAGGGILLGTSWRRRRSGR